MMETRTDELRKLFLKSAIAARDAARAERDAARAEVAALRDKLDATRAELRKVGDQGVSARLDRAEARAEAAELRKTLRAVLDILKSGRSTGRNAIKALFAAEDVVMSALDGDNSAQDAA